MTSRGPFRPKTFYDSMKIWNISYKTAPPVAFNFLLIFGSSLCFGGEKKSGIT